MGMGMGMGRRAGGCSSRAFRRAFSLIELVVVIGVVMILIGLLMPALASAREQALRTRDLASARGAFVLLSQYTDDNADRFPVGGLDAVQAARHWYLPLAAGGYIQSWRDIGIASPDQNESLLALSQTAIINQDVFQPSSSGLLSAEPVAAQRTQSIGFPSQKGILFQHYVYTSSWEGEWCCLRAAPPAPVAFADGSAVVSTYQQFQVSPPPDLARMAGVPVVSTWAGLAGRDLLSP